MPPLRAVLPRAGTYLVPYLVAAALGATGAATWIQPPLTIAGGMGLMLAATLTIYFFEPWSVANLRAWCLTAAMMIGWITILMVSQAIWSSVLDHRGQQVVARVAEVHPSFRNDAPTYTLTHDGMTIPGRLSDWPGHDPFAGEETQGSAGELVVVIRYPEGLVDPRLPEELAAAQGALATAAILLVVIAILCLVAARGYDREAFEERRYRSEYRCALALRSRSATQYPTRSAPHRGPSACDEHDRRALGWGRDDDRAA